MDETAHRPIEDEPEQVFISNTNAVSAETRTNLRNAALQIREADTSTDDLNDLITAYQTTSETLEAVAENPGVDTATVQTALERTATIHNRLLEIRAAYIEAKRKLVLTDNGLQVAHDDITSLQERIENATEYAKKFGRSTDYLEMVANKLANRQDSHGSQTVRSTANDERGTAPENPTTQAIGGSKNTTPDGLTTNPDTTTQQGATSGHRYSVGDLSRNTPNRTDLIEDLERISDELGRVPKPVDIQKRSAYPDTAFISEFGSWDDTLTTVFVDTASDGTPLPFETHDGGETNTATSSSTTDTQADPNRVEEPPQSTSESSEDSSADSSDGQPTQEELISALEAVSEDLGKRPTTKEYTTHSDYSSIDIYRVFDSWTDALEAAEIEELSREQLLADLERLADELGYPPLSSDVEERGQFSTYDYRQAFGSVDKAREELNLDPDLREHVLNTLRTVVAEHNGQPKMADFEAAAPYSANVIYKLFDSWGDALDTVQSTTEKTTYATAANAEPGTETTNDAHEDALVQNELSEYYELVRNLRDLCVAVIKARPDDTDDSDDPMVAWADRITAFWKDGPESAESYGAQQSDRNPFKMRDYRGAFGNGDRVTEFEHCVTRPLPASLRTLLDPHLEEDISAFHLPVDEERNAIFPVIVQSHDEVRRATALLDRLPAEPASAEIPEDDGGDPRVEPTPTEDLTDVNGVTDEIANDLQAAGYKTRSDLKEASMDDLTDVAAVNKQLAMRIKVDVGG